MSTTLRISLAQVNSGIEPHENLKVIDSQAQAAKEAGASLVIFPEAMMRRFGLPLREIAEPVHGPWADAVREISQRHGITIVAGMFTPADEGRVANTLLVTGDGVDASYDKIHLFDAFGFAESDTVAPGRDPLVVDVNGIKVGFATCYDIRFPALFHKLGDLGAELIVVAASWGSGPGKVEQWSLLARARALDSTAFVAACDQSEPEETADTAPLGVGHSVIASPTGEVLGQLDATPGLLTVDIDTAIVDSTRTKLPVLSNRRRFD